MVKNQIMIVEDEVVIAKDIKNTLENFGYFVSGTVTTGEKAVEKAKESKPDLVFMDIFLNGEMDGIEAAQTINDYLGIPVIYLTAYADEKIIERAKKTGPFSYLIKPFQGKELHASIQMALFKSGNEKKLKELNEKRRVCINNLQETLILTETILKGLLPVCSYCKKIQGPKGRWIKFDKYVKKQNKDKFSQGICPECCKKL